MKDYIVIQARVGSKRFPNKVLKKINNKTILETIIARLKKTVLKNNMSTMLFREYIKHWVALHIFIKAEAMTVI